MRLAFRLAADWIGDFRLDRRSLALEEAAAAASDLVTARFPAAARVYSARKWIAETASSAAIELLRDLVTAVVVTDHFNTRTPIPTSPNRMTGASWCLYLNRRLADCKAIMPEILANWAILRCIPANWLPNSHVAAKISQRLKRSSRLSAAVVADLTPPVSGGAVWLRQACAERSAALAWHARERPVAAVIHWPGQTAACVVVPSPDGRLRAYGRNIEPACNEIAFKDAQLVSATMLTNWPPPMAWPVQMTHLLGLKATAWSLLRRYRTRREGQKNVHV